MLMLIVALLVSGAVPAVAGPLEDADAAYARSDFATALHLWRPLAEQGNARAQNNLGFMYDIGQGVPQDYAAALAWYRKAADQGDANAQNNIGIMYANGEGVPQNYVQAHMWLNLSADQGNADGIKNRESIAKKMMRDEIAEAQKLAREWKPK